MAKKNYFEKDYGIIIEHESSGLNVEEVASELSINIENIVKAILLEYKEKDPVLCIIRSVDKLSSKKIKNRLCKSCFSY